MPPERAYHLILSDKKEYNTHSNIPKQELEDNG